MAARDDLAILKAARTGAAEAQLAIGTRYYLGNGSLPQSTETAFYWLERAARQGLPDAWTMIGRAVPYDLVRTMSRPYEAATWYERAFDSGVFEAGIVFSRLVLENSSHFSDRSKEKAVSVLKQLAERDDHEAQWLLAQHLARLEDDHRTAPDERISLVPPLKEAKEHWTKQAALAGVAEAQYSILEKCWQTRDYVGFYENAAPIINSVLKGQESQIRLLRDPSPHSLPLSLSDNETELFLRQSQIILERNTPDIPYAQRLLEVAALSQNHEAQYRLGMLYARIDHDCERVFPRSGQANYLAAVPWLNAAGKAGVAEAWHGLSMIYAKAEYFQRNLSLSRQYLNRSAEMGFAQAQFDYGQYLWRTRRDAPMHDIHALSWWKKAADQGHHEAQIAVSRFSAQNGSETWATEIARSLTTKMRKSHPFLSARIDLAAAFKLSKSEAVLVDVRHADHGHCIEVDISKLHARSKRRLILVESAYQRMTLDLISRLFADVNSSFDGPEGNYRQRQYRLRNIIAEIG
ncbi:tetratricopeptide repeat protein [Herbaspirillum huttiense]|uniref:tetratricopeptide repeat protein n=1 Tax=Herbaspirillum huttiense TaxID=863372 RepID=UPI0038782D1B